MPWQPEDAPHHTKKADTVELCEMWSEVANKVLTDTGNEAGPCGPPMRSSPEIGRKRSGNVPTEEQPEAELGLHDQEERKSHYFEHGRPSWNASADRQ
jgi:hypothetical protein